MGNAAMTWSPKRRERGLFSTDIDASKYWQYEKNLRLLIKLPAVANTSTITILEGNYTASVRCQNSIVSDFAIDDKNGWGVYPTRLSLLDMNDGVSYPFADRLVEYLSGNVITPRDKITNNIGRLQIAAYSDTYFKGSYDIWDPNLRITIFNKLNNKTTQKNFYNIYLINSESSESIPIVDINDKIKFIDTTPDLLSYGDKDTETFLGVAR